MASKKPTAANFSALAIAAAATNGQGPALFATPAEMKFWTDFAGGPYVESNPEMKDPADPNKIAFRATAAGVKLSAENAAKSAPPAGAATATAGANTGATDTATDSEFVLEDGISIPPLRRGGRGTGRAYPFASMGVGQSFFIPKTDDNPKPSKRIAAVVSTASKNLDPKKFKVQAVVEAIPGGAAGATREGARIWRTA